MYWIYGLLLRLTERIWLRAFGTSPKSCFAGLQIRSERYTLLQNLVEDVKM